MVDNLTGLRFFMALWVVLYHVRDAVNIPIVHNIFKAGYLGVDVFFVLSGYILTHVYYDTFFTKRSTRVERIEFIKKRFARIYPLHLVTLIAAVIFMVSLNLFLTTKSELHWNHLVPQFFLVHSWGTVRGIHWNFPSWSVSSEWFAYLFLFPLTHYLFRKGSIKLSMAVSTLVLIVYMIITWKYFNNDIGSQLDTGFIRIIPEFMLGSTVYLWFWKSRHVFPIPFVVVGYLAMIILSFILFENLQFVFILMVPALLLLLHMGNRIVDLLFGNKVIFFLGEVSYSIYMVHFFSRAINGIIQRNFFGNEVNSPIYFFNYIALTIGFSILTYFIVEIPSRKYINRIKILVT